MTVTPITPSALNRTKVRRPTGAVPWPLVLVEGGEKSGKSWACATFSASEKVGQTYWIDLGEGSADEYGAIPGVRYMVVEHDGSWQQILTAVQEIRAEAQRASDAGEPPVVLVVDSITAEWDLLKNWASARARKRKNKAEDAEVKVDMDLWNDATDRHRRLMTLLMTFPGIVVVTARGKEVAAMDESNRPIANTKEYKVEGQKALAFDATVWVRMVRGSAPLIIGARSVHAGVKPADDKPREAPNFSLEWLVFDVLKCDPSGAHTRALAVTDEQGHAPGRSPEELRAAAVEVRDGLRPDMTRSELLAAYQKAGETPGLLAVTVVDGQGDEVTLDELIKALGREASARQAQDAQEQAPAAVGGQA
jgi:hypothetical protein